MAEESIPQAAQPQSVSEPGAGPRRGRRAGRGHRGRGRRRKPAPPHTGPGANEPAEPAADLESSDAPGVAAEQAEPSAMTHEPPAEQVERRESASAREEFERAPESTRAPQPASRSTSSTPSLQRTLDHVNDVISTLRDALEEMEEVLETLELFERQGDADERELESLRRALRHLQRPREGGSHHGRHG